MEVVRMKQEVDHTEVSKEFMSLSGENRDYVLAIARALSFAQKAIPNPAPKIEYEQQEGV